MCIRDRVITGHRELDSLQFAGLNNALLDQYDVFKVSLSSKNQIRNYDLLIIAKPTRAFTEMDKYKLDQYLMQGGKILFLDVYKRQAINVRGMKITVIIVSSFITSFIL